MYGPITTLRRDGRIVKHIPWSAFKMGDLDWTRVTDARDILLVSTFISKPRTRTHMSFRTLIASNSISPPKSSQRYGVHSPRLKSYKLHGRRNPLVESMRCTRMRSVMAFRRLESITRVSMRNRVLSSHWVMQLPDHLISRCSRIFYSSSSIL